MNFLLTKLGGQGLVSLVGHFMGVLPLANIVRVCLYKSFSLTFFGLLFLSFLVFWVVLRLSPTLYLGLIRFTFSKTLVKWRYLLSLGPLILKRYPRWFGLYVFVSASCVYIVRFYPEIEWVYPFHILFLVSRNLFIIPITGFGLIIQAHRLLCEKVDQSGEQSPVSGDSVPFPLFPE